MKKTAHKLDSLLNWLRDNRAGQVVTTSDIQAGWGLGSERLMPRLEEKGLVKAMGSGRWQVDGKPASADEFSPTQKFHRAFLAQAQYGTITPKQLSDLSGYNQKRAHERLQYYIAQGLAVKVGNGLYRATERAVANTAKDRIVAPRRRRKLAEIAAELEKIAAELRETEPHAKAQSR